MNEVRIHTSVSGNAGKEVKGLSDAWTQFQKKGAEGLKIGVGIAATQKAFSLLDSAMSAAVEGIGDSVRAASDLNETVSKSSVIFGKHADGVNAWADTMDDAAGQSKRAALDAASGFAGLFKTVGLGIDESTTMAKGLTQMGSDLASFFNTDVDDALQALKSGLNGESEPLRRFNVFLSETAVTAKLTEMGIKKVAGKFTEAQKATARYALIMEQTGDAQGDFARTSDGMANSTRTLDAKLENLSARLGQTLIPAVEGGIGTILRMADAIDTATDSEQSFEDRLGGVTDILNHINPLTVGYTLAMDDLKAKQEAAAEATAATEAATRAAGKAAKDAARDHQHAGAGIAESYTDMAHEGWEATADLKRALRGLVGAAEKTRDDLAAIGSAAADVLFDPLIAQADYAATKREQAEQRAIIANKNSTKEQVRDAKDRLLELRKTAMEQEIALVGWGMLNAKEQKKLLANLKRDWADATGEAKQRVADLIAALELLDRKSTVDIFVRGSGRGGGSIGGKATGGYVPPGDVSWVGEHGKKELIEALPGGGVMVHPMDGGAYGLKGGSGQRTSAAGTASIMTLNLNVHTPVLTPGGAQALADIIAPSVIRWAQVRQLLGAR